MKINLNSLSNIIKIISTGDKNTSGGTFTTNADLPTQSTIKHKSFNFGRSIELNNLSALQQKILLKDLLNLPKEWRELLSILLSNSLQNAQGKMPLNNKSQIILFQQIQNLLDSNSKEVINKLLKLIQPSQSNIQNIDQLKEAVNHFNTKKERDDVLKCIKTEEYLLDSCQQVMGIEKETIKNLVIELTKGNK